MKKLKEKYFSTAETPSLKIKINKSLDSMEDATFFKKKMDKGCKILAIAGLPE